MTNKQLNKLNDELEMMITSVDDLADRFNGSGNLVDDVHQFAREHKTVGHNIDILLTAMKLAGVLRALQFEVTEPILQERRIAESKKESR